MPSAFVLKFGTAVFGISAGARCQWDIGSVISSMQGLSKKELLGHPEARMWQSKLSSGLKGKTALSHKLNVQHTPSSMQAPRWIPLAEHISITSCRSAQSQAYRHRSGTLLLKLSELTYATSGNY